MTVIVGLRPFSAKSNILPEQAVGRGLRLMFGLDSGYAERVDVIGSSGFIKFVEELEKEEQLELETFEVGKDKTPDRHHPARTREDGGRHPSCRS